MDKKESKYLVTYKSVINDSGEIKQTIIYAENIKEATKKARILLSIKDCRILKVKYLGIARMEQG